jgi:ATP-dependent exoDNAse (exonuclease V) beta subunit
MVKPLTVYKASAGSGKTFTLATEYIRLLVENPQSYRTILAVTFTNKATEEMKMRILSQLYGIAHQLPDSDGYLQAIQERTGFDSQLISQRAAMALDNLLNNYNYFRVETIDTFFQSVLRNMARELDLTTNLRIGLNDYQVEELAVDQLISDLTTTDLILQWILKYIMENIQDDKSWNVISQIKTFGRHIFRDDYKAVSRQLEQKMSEPGFFDDYTRRLRDVRQAAEERMKQIGESFFETLESEQLTIDDLSNKNRGIAGFFLKLQKGIFDPTIENATVANCLGNAEKWVAKTHPRRELILSLADGTLGDILRYAVDERPRQWRLYKSADLTLRHLNQLRLLSSIEQKVHALNEANNRFLLSDTQQLLHSLIGESDSPFIFEKIGTQIEHVMIDEFQDTSTIQWRNFHVLLAEAMSHEHTSNLIVGDVKQSIYRWRSGDWRLLNGIENQFSEQQIETRNLQTNYRSQRRVIAFNNAFFRHAAQLEYLAQQELSPLEAEQLKKAYADVEQLIPDKREDAGLVDIRLLPAADYEESVLQQMTDIVTSLMAQNVSQRSIAILVRNNASIPVIARHFLATMPGVSIVSDEAFRLDASSAVCLIVSALRLLVHPDDQLTKAAIVKTWQQDILHRAASDNELLLADNNLDALLPPDYIEAFTALRSLPLYELCERLYAIFRLSEIEGQGAYLCAFYDQLTDFISDNTSDIDTFLHEWDENLHTKTIQSDETNGIRLISIHKSKGLEFAHVICPFCDWPLEHTGNVLWCTPTEAPFSDLPIAPIDYSQKHMMGTIYEPDYLQEHLQTTVDNLNLLYVAFTRACESLYVIGRRGAKTTRSALIEQALPLVANDLQSSILEGLNDDAACLRFSYGAHVIPSAVEGSPSLFDNPFLQKASSIHVPVETFAPKATFKQSNRSRAFTEGDDEETLQRRNYIQTGSILHEVFSTIRTADDIPDALERLQFEGVLYDEQTTPERITSLIRKRLEDPRVADWFSPRWTLFNECTILSIDDDGQVRERRPDRVMTDGQQWIVVDFKFGAPKPEYVAQVQEYMQLLASMGHQNIHGYLWFVYSNKIEEIPLNS